MQMIEKFEDEHITLLDKLIKDTKSLTFCKISDKEQLSNIDNGMQQLKQKFRREQARMSHLGMIKTKSS